MYLLSNEKRNPNGLSAARIAAILAVIATVAAAVFVCFSSETSAADESGTIGDTITWEYVSGTKTLTVTGTGAIPDYEEYNGAPWYDCTITTLEIGDGITSIGKNSFRNSKITSVTLPDSVDRIGDYAFYNTSDLTTVGFGNGVSYIGEYAFTTSKITVIDVKGTGDGVIGAHAFENCYSVTSINIGSGFVTIGEAAFKGCGGVGLKDYVSSITLGEGIITISDEAFYHADVRNLVIPDSVKTIGASAFQSSIETLTLGKGLTTVGKWAFSSNNISTLNLNSVRITTDFNSNNGKLAWDKAAEEITVTIGSEVEYIPSRMFELDSNNALLKLKTVTMSDSVTEIGEKAFYGCAGLTSLTLSASLETVGVSAFEGCTGLTALTIPETVKSIGRDGFKGCTGLKTVNYNAARFDADPDYYPFASSGNAETGMTVTFGPNVKAIPAKIFGYTNIGPTVTIPVGVESIGEYAFSNCGKIVTVNYDAENASAASYVFSDSGSSDPGMTVNFESSVVSIPAGILSGVANVKNVTIADGVKTIGNSAVYETGIQSITIPASVTSIGSNAFSKNLALTEIIYNATNCVLPGKACPFICANKVSDVTATIGDGITTIPSYLFSGMIELKAVTIGKDVTAIGPFAFNGCKGLTSLTIPKAVATIGDMAFGNCSGITQLNFNAANCSIGSNVFTSSGSSGGFAVAFGEGVTAIPDELFSGMTNLKSVSLPSTLKTIGDSAFYYAGVSGELEIPDSVTTIGENAFENTAITSVTIGKGVVTLGERCFYKCNALEHVTLNATALESTSSSFPDDGRQFDLTIGSGVTNLAFAFSGNPYLTGEVIIPDSVGTINTGEFSGCTRITSVTIGNGVTEICKDAFNGCTGITTLTVGTAVETIGQSAFSGMNRLARIEYNAVDASGFNNLAVFPIADSGAELVIGDGVTALPYNMFKACIGLKIVTFGNSLKSIPAGAFWGTPIQDVILPDGLESIASDAFGSCANLASITIPSSAANIASDAFGTLSFYDWDGSRIGSVGPSTVAGYQFSMADSKMTKEKHGFAFDLGYEAEKSPLLGIVGKTVPAVEDPERNHYTFDRWCSDDELTTPYEFSVFPEGFLTLYARWIPDTYTVKFVLNGGDGSIPDAVVEYPGKVSKPADPVRTGYQFQGWKVGETYYDFEDTVIGDMTLTANWEPKSYTIVLKGYGFDEGRAIVKYYQKVSSHEAVGARPGYSLVGFFTEQEGGVGVVSPEYALESEVDSYTDAGGNWTRDGGVTLYAHWKPMAYEVDLMPNGGSDKGYAGFTYGSDGVLGFLPVTRTGYDCLGYFTNESAGVCILTHDGKLRAGTIYTDEAGNWTWTQAVSLYAHWQIKSFELVLHANDGDSNGTATVTYGSSDVTGFATVSRTGYTLNGFFTAADAGSELIDKDGKLKANIAEYTDEDGIWISETGIELYAQWTADTYKVILDKNGGDTDGKATATFDGGLSSITAADRTGYSLLGYYKDAGCTVKVADKDGNLLASVEGYTDGVKGWIRTSDTRLFAAWEANTYIVTYNVNEGDALTPNTLEVTYGEAYELATPTRESKFFSGWMYDGDIVANSGTWNIADNVTLVAQWSDVKTFEVSFSGGPGATGTVSSIFATENSVIQLPSKGFTRAGHTFEHWIYDGELFDEGADFTVKEDCEITVDWSVNSYKISYFLDGVKLTEYADEKEYGTEITVPAAYKKTGYDVTPWTTDDVAVTDGKFVVPDCDVEFNATSSPATYTVTLDRNDGASDGTAKVTFDTAGPAAGLVPAVRTGHDVTGYYTAAKDGTLVINADGSYVSRVDGYTSEDGKWIRAEDTKLYAGWEIQTHRITIYYVYGDSSQAAPKYTIELDYGEVYSVESPAITGYKPDRTVVTGNMGTLDIEDTVVYTPGQYTITFESNGGSAVESMTRAYKSSISAPDAPVRDGYTFVDWMRDGEVFEFSTMPAEDFTLVAEWEIITYTVTYMLDGGTNAEGNIAGFDIETEAFTLLDPVKEHYTFGGWFGNDSFTGDAVTAVAGGATGNVVLYAKWVPEEYTVHFDLNGAAGSIPDAEVQYPGKVSAPADPEREGYAFWAWQIDGEDYDFSAVVTADITLTALWAPLPAIEDGVIAFSDDSETVEIDIGMSQVTDALDDASTTEVAISGNGWTMDIPKDVIKNATGFVSAASKELSESDIEALPEKARAALNGKTVFSLNLSDANGPIDFSGSKVKMSLAYTLKSGENASNLKLYYLDAENNAVKVDATYDSANKCVVFDTDHFSTWFVDFTAPSSSGSGGDNLMIIIAVVVIIALVAVVFVLMKMGIIPGLVKKA